MRSATRILMTTTPTIEGATIERYHGLVAAQLVIGTGIFTDIASTFTDLFGAQSRAHEEKMEKIRLLALSELQEKAHAMEANAVVGIRLDFDEISAGGKSMLMLSGLGTAVTVRWTDSRAKSRATSLDAESVEAAAKRHYFLDAAARGALRWTDEVWKFMIEHRVAEAVPFALAKVEEYVRQYPSGGETIHYKEYIRDLLARVDPDVVKTRLYATIRANGPAADFAANFLAKSDLFDPAEVEYSLESDSFDVRRRALQTIRGHARAYSPEDIERMESLERAIENAFSERAEYFEKKKVVGSPVRMWKCANCGNEEEASRERCQRCQRDTWGFAPSEIHPLQAIDMLHWRISALRGLLGIEAVPASAG